MKFNVSELHAPRKPRVATRDVVLAYNHDVMCWLRPNEAEMLQPLVNTEDYQLVILPWGPNANSRPTRPLYLADYIIGITAHEARAGTTMSLKVLKNRYEMSDDRSKFIMKAIYDNVVITPDSAAPTECDGCCSL